MYSVTCRLDHSEGLHRSSYSWTFCDYTLEFCMQAVNLIWIPRPVYQWWQLKYTHRIEQSMVYFYVCRFFARGCSPSLVCGDSTFCRILQVLSRGNLITLCTPVSIHTVIKTTHVLMEIYYPSFAIYYLPVYRSQHKSSQSHPPVSKPSLVTSSPSTHAWSLAHSCCNVIMQLLC